MPPLAPLPDDAAAGPSVTPEAGGPADVAAHPPAPPSPAPSRPSRPTTPPRPARPARAANGIEPARGVDRASPELSRPGHVATAPQLRRFIKSRAYVPMHELRRRFAINGGEDDVTVVDVDQHRIFVGLPEREGQLLGELLQSGDIGYELSLDPISPIVVGVYPMRPVSRT